MPARLALFGCGDGPDAGPGSGPAGGTAKGTARGIGCRAAGAGVPSVSGWRVTGAGGSGGVMAVGEESSPAGETDADGGSGVEMSGGAEGPERSAKPISPTIATVPVSRNAVDQPPSRPA